MNAVNQENLSRPQNSFVGLVVSKQDWEPSELDSNSVMQTCLSERCLSQSFQTLTPKVRQQNAKLTMWSSKVFNTWKMLYCFKLETTQGHFITLSFPFGIFYSFQTHRFKTRSQICLDSVTSTELQVFSMCWVKLQRLLKPRFFKS